MGIIGQADIQNFVLSIGWGNGEPRAFLMGLLTHIGALFHRGRAADSSFAKLIGLGLKLQVVGIFMGFCTGTALNPIT